MACIYDYTDLQVMNVCPTKSSFINTMNLIMLQISIERMWQYSILNSYIMYLFSYVCMQEVLSSYRTCTSQDLQ